jgi:hypothetical protein
MAPAGSPLTLIVTPPVEPVRLTDALTLPIDPPCGRVTDAAASEREMLLAGGGLPPELLLLWPPPHPLASTKTDSKPTAEV